MMKIPPDILSNLVNDEEYEIRLAVARNKNTPKDTLIKLLQDEIDEVRVAVIKNPNLFNNNAPLPQQNKSMTLGM